MAEGQDTSSSQGQAAKPKRVTVTLAKPHKHRDEWHQPGGRLQVWDWQAERMRAHGEIKE